MLTSIHPLGERARNNQWWLTAAAFAVGAVGTAALVGGLLGALGGVVLPVAAGTLLPIGILVAAAAVLDLASVPVPGPQRQVNERWIGTFRGWVYGGAFGAQLGAGFATYVVTWLTWATFGAAALTGNWVGGALIGTAFGAGRTVPVLVGRWIDRPSRLVAMSTTMARIAKPAFTTAAATAGVLGAAAIVAGVG